MKVAKFKKYGPPGVIHFEDVPVPTIGSTELLIKVRTTAVTVADARIRAANFPKGYGIIARPLLGLFKPRQSVQVLGTVYSGVVTNVGKDVTSFKVGDEVMGMRTPPNLGTYVEYIVVDSDSAIAVKPRELSHIDASGLLFGGTTALYFLRDLAKIKSGDEILVIGASGAVGTNMIQLARYYGAKVTAVCSEKNKELVKELGAHQVIDYTTQKFDSFGKYDLVASMAPGYELKHLAVLLKSSGKLLLILSDFWELIQANVAWLRPKSLRLKKILVGVAPERKEDVELLAKLAADGLIKVVIDKVYPFERVVEAHEHVDTGHKVGNVVLEMK